MKFNTAVFEMVCNHVRQEAQTLQVDGIFAMTQIGESLRSIHWDFVGRASVVDNASDGKKYNLLGIALGKVSAAMRLHEDLRGEFIGETPYEGWRFSEDGRFIYAFSGATEKQDVQLCESAARFHKQKFHQPL